MTALIIFLLGNWQKWLSTLQCKVKNVLMAKF